MSERLTSFSHDGYRFDVRDVGPLDGPVLVALHGFPQTSAEWEPMLPRLTAAGYRVLAPDQRGYSSGARPVDVTAYRLEHLVDDVLALADAAGVDRFHLLGHDWGGGVAWALAAWHPDRLHTLSVVSTPHPRAMVAAMRGRQALRSWYILAFQLPRLPELLLRVQGGRGADLLLRRTGARDTADAVALLADPATATGAVNWYRALRLPGQRPVGAVAVPTLYVWSDGDTALDRRGADGTGRWVSGPYRYRVLPGVSHWVPEERPDELAALVLDRMSEPG